MFLYFFCVYSAMFYNCIHTILISLIIVDKDLQTKLGMVWEIVF